MNENSSPEPSAPERSSKDESDQDKEWFQAQLEMLKSDPTALDRLRGDPTGCAVLMRLAESCDYWGDRNLVITWLAVTFPHEPTLRGFLFNRLQRERLLVAPLYAILANYAEDESVIRELVAILREFAPGHVAELLPQFFGYRPFPGIIHAAYQPPFGISEEAWEDWTFSIKSATPLVLPHPGLQDLIFDIMRRDPDGQMELEFREILRPLVGKTLKPPRKRAWRIEETWDKKTLHRKVLEHSIEVWKGLVRNADDPDKRRQYLERLERAEHNLRVHLRFFDTPPKRVQYHVPYDLEPSPEQVAAWARLADAVRDMSGKLAALHPKWPHIEDYVQELDSVGKRRLPGSKLPFSILQMDLECRQARVARRMSRFPDQAAVRNTFETMLFDRPAIFPKGVKEMDYHTCEPVGWRHVAWDVLTTSLWSVNEAVDFARCIVDLGPWDNEARKSKEAIGAVIRAWPKEESVLAFVGDIVHHADVGAFARDEVGKLFGEAQAGKNIRLDRYYNKFYA
jgi:hypothetical protein